MHTVVAQRMEIDSKRIDHIDHKPLNNQRSNLRSATGSQNSHNRWPQSNSKTGVKGVCFEKARGKYRARIEVEGKLYSLGCFDTILEAEAVVVSKRKELMGEFACA